MSSSSGALSGAGPRIRRSHLEDTIMHWAAVFLAAYAAGLVEFWRLCDTAPLMHADQLGPAA